MILKFGSRGNEVKELQEFLEIKADGVFGKGTENAVKNWQSLNGLIDDGIVGPLTLDCMGIASTDNSEKCYLTTNDLLINKHFLPSGEYKEGAWNKEYVFLHHTAGWHNPYQCIDNWANDDRGSIATEFVLGGPSIKGKNGSQHMHIHSVGIEVCNFGYIVNGKTYAGQVADDSQIVTLPKEFRGHKTWHRYSNKQIEILKNWILFIAERDNINVRAGLPALIKEKGIEAFEWNEDAYYGKVKGLWTHTNTRKDKVDMFPQQELIDMLISL